MTEPIQLLTVEQAVALVEAIPDFIDNEGAKRQAVAIESVRRPGWHLQIPRRKIYTLPNGKQIEEPLASFVDDVAQVAAAQVVIGGYRIPVILAQAILGAYYVAREAGEIVPTTQLAPTPQEPTP